MRFLNEVNHQNALIAQHALNSFLGNNHNSEQYKKRFGHTFPLSINIDSMDSAELWDMWKKTSGVISDIVFSTEDPDQYKAFSEADKVFLKALMGERKLAKPQSNNVSTPIAVKA